MKEKYANLELGTSALTGEIFIGRLNKDKTMWLDGKTIITEKALNVVIEHLYIAEMEYTQSFKDGKKRTLCLLSEEEINLIRDNRKNKE